jgi:hypothetical protein
MLMPQDAVLYLFYPELDRRQILKMNGFSDRLSFFEYAGLHGAESGKTSVRICKWIPAAAIVLSPFQGEERSRVPGSQASFLRHAYLTPQEIAGLAELSLALHRA